MTISLFSLLIVWMLFSHYICDFVIQTDWQAKNKSSNIKALSLHILTYTLGMTLAVAVMPFAAGLSIPLLLCVKWAAINGMMHFATDYVTSRISSRFYKKGDNSMFWATIGLDQFIHAATIIISLGILISL